MKVNVTGEIKATEIKTPTISVDAEKQSKLQELVASLTEKMKEPKTPVELREDFNYLKDIKDAYAKQMGVNWLINNLAAQGFVIQIIK